MSVTYSTKCYTFVCCGCGMLSQSERRDTMTCSPACRVRAHRSGELKRRRDICKSMDIKNAANMGHVDAARRLVPDLFEKVKRGDKRPDGWPMEIDDIQPEVNRAFMELLMEKVRNTSGETLREST